jgi:hypothetical protein
VPSLASVLSTFIEDERDLWFPGLAPLLVANFAETRPMSGDIATYSTQGWLAGIGGEPAAKVGHLTFGRYTSSIERLSVAAYPHFPDLTFGTSEPADWIPQLRAAGGALSIVDGLADTVGCVARSIHVLRAPTDYDVSHSTPALPFSIFVSVPAAEEKDATLRLAESLVHEAMHLQLTLVDQAQPLVIDGGGQGYSPWKQELRPIEGLIQGLYVFAVIYQVLGIFGEAELRARKYCLKRRVQIEDEVASLPLEPDGLSPLGQTLWRRCRLLYSPA